MDPFIGEIRVFAFSFAPAGWAECRGQLLPASQNKALFSLLGNLYGGDKNTFALPNLEALAPVSQGQGEGLSNYAVGEEGGALSVTLTEAEIPAHIHQPQGTTEPADVQAPGEDRILARSTPGYAYHGEVTKNLVKMSPQSTTGAGSDQPHDNMSPAMVLRYCIALQGVYPNRP